VTRAAGPLNSVYKPTGVVRAEDGTQPADAIMVHQGVSPNGDGVNDFLVIDGIRSYPDNKLLIIDRNGALVFEADGYDNSSKPFDGHSNKNGKMQPPGTYFYSLYYKIGKVTRHKTGFIVLKY
jgi:gliding motility-associated-like protein